jgi:hypothetical protein
MYVTSLKHFDNVFATGGNNIVEVLNVIVRQMALNNDVSIVQKLAVKLSNTSTMLYFISSDVSINQCFI